MGEDVATAVRNGKRYVTRVIRHAYEPGRGHAVGDAFYFMDISDWDSSAKR